MMEFAAAYDAVLAKWPGPVDSLEVDTPFGATRVNACGAVEGEPLLLLHGGGATSTVWFNNVGPLARRHRVLAVDQINDAGRSVPSGQPVRTRGDLMAWLDAVLAGLPIAGSVRICGHSYGGWLALNYAMHAPERVARLALLDPSECFAGMSLSYKLRALPLFLPGAKPARMRSFLRWETRGARLDPDWLRLVTLAAGVQTPGIVMPRRPDPRRLRELPIPTLVLVAERTRSHDPAAVAANAKQLLPRVETAVLDGATHHTIPVGAPEAVNAHLDRFLADG